MSSSSQTSNWRSWPWLEPVICNHDLEAEVVTSKTEANLGRRFYRCQIWKHDDCKFFRWIDPSLSMNQENYFKKLKMERDSIEEALRKRVDMQDILEEKARSKAEELEALQTVVDNLRYTIRNLKFVVVFLCIVVWLMM